MFIAIRGVGWHFSRVRTIVRHDGDLLINGRWRIEVPPSAGEVRVGIEGPDGWTVPDDQTVRAASAIGWGFARIGPLARGSIRIMVHDQRADESVDTVMGTLGADWPVWPSTTTPVR
jgi:hypothetical protein